MNDKEEPKLKRHIGFLGLTLYGVGDILGAGIYGLIGKAAGLMGNALWVGFLISMLAAMLTGLSYAALGSRFPRAAGGSYVIFKVFKSSFFAYLIGLVTLASAFTSMATALRALSGYAFGLFPFLIPQAGVPLFAVVIAFLVFKGIRHSIFANTVCTLIELCGLFIVIALGISYLGEVDYLQAKTLANPSGALSLPLMVSGAVLTFYSFIGFEDVLNVAEEVKEPKKTLPWALLTAIGIASSIYLVVGLVAVSVLSGEELSRSQEPLVDVVKAAAPWFPSGVFSLVALFAVANTALLNFIMSSRLSYGLARMNLAPKFLSFIHPKNHTPSHAVGAIFLIVLLLAFLGDIATLAKATSFLILLVFCGMNFTLLWLKVKKDKTPTLFDVPWPIPALGLLVCFTMLFFVGVAELKVAGGLIAFIIAMYFFIRSATLS